VGDRTCLVENFIAGGDVTGGMKAVGLVEDPSKYRYLCPSSHEAQERPQTRGGGDSGVPERRREEIEGRHVAVIEDGEDVPVVFDWFPGASRSGRRPAQGVHGLNLAEQLTDLCTCTGDRLFGGHGHRLGWLIFTGLFGIGDTDVFDLGGIIGAIVGSILVLLVVGWFMRRTGRLSRPAR
jgi:hypothetical protein